MTEKANDQKGEKKTTADPMRVLARRAVEIAASGGKGLGSSITAPQASDVKAALGDAPLEPFAPATVDQLLAYAAGGRGAGREHLPDEALKRLRDFCGRLESRRIWPRKVAALALALHEQQVGVEVTPRSTAVQTKKTTEQ